MRSKKYKVFIIAGEASGDLIGNKLISALNKKEENIEFKGVGGDMMINAGLINTFPMQDLSVMGYLEVIPAIPRIIQRLKQTVRNILEYNPDLIITIDSPGFNFRVVNKIRKLRGDTVKIVHYVAPSVWAYKPERVIKVASLYDHLLMILPIEKQYFESHVNCTYVGHPIVEQDLRAKQPVDKIRKKYGLKSDEKLIALMPGSRKGEIKRHIDPFVEAIEILKKKHKIQVFVPTLKSLEKLLRKHLDGFLITSDNLKKKELLTAADVALIKSGTSSVEMLSYKTPTVVAYKMNPLTYLYIKNKIKVKFASLANIVRDKKIIPEFIQKKCTPQNLAGAIDDLLTSKDKKQKQLEEFEKVLEIFKGDGKKLPSESAADVIVKILKK